MKSATILAVVAILEALAGLALVSVPSVVARALLGGDLEGTDIAVGRVAGFGLLSLAIACWPRPRATLPAFLGMLTYNLLTTAYLVYFWLQGGSGKLLIPAIATHALFVLLLAQALLRDPTASSSPGR